ncbi:inositol-tetrakisphosphate 1-kinase [Syncephalastrum racemosum]|uniref:inositol-1,3,4-trisphosphate 5/6-kinase n=1 Tax=Syncephalastrum racemosum TaxID=13706 RepID=A0A1X2HHI5_SYNRA|nr:inositol-tetrakisphosphate 1-kinase [Syncephalastrum racemosum]
MDLHHRLLAASSRGDFKVPTTLAYTSIRDAQRERPDAIRFPVICKRRSACSSVEAHQMCLIPSRQAMSAVSDFDSPLVLQEFIEHDGILIKVYVADGELYISTRPSFKNLSTQTTSPIYFDSQTLPKQFGLPNDVDMPWLCQHLPQEPTLDRARLQRIASCLQEQLGLTFYGFDVLLQYHTGVHYVVDVNYFPSFKNVPDFQDIFLQILKKRLPSL